MNERIPLATLVPLRLLFGVILVLEGWGKLRGGWLHGTALLNTLSRWVSDGKPYPFFLPMLETARAHPKIFGTLVTAGELVVGASMVLGLFTRFASFLGAVMLFSFAAGAGQGLAPPGNAVLMGAVFLIFMLAPPGRVLGIDRLLRDRVPRWLV
jgi:thiosulfate dehydrogenase [quinone] large subunit